MTGAGLEVRGLRVAYGGNVAVDGVSFDAPAGRITGLIGPNGAGKTSTFNACSGVVRSTAGTVTLFDRDVTHASTAARARAGLGRTFQQVQVCLNLTVAENVALAAEIRLVGRNPVRQLIPGARGRSVDVRQRTDDALERCGIGQLAATPASVLSTGQKRLVELARVLAGGYRILLLDEPSSGLDHDETEKFGRIITEVVADEAIGILLVEHDMELVMSCCQYIYVMDFGEPIFEGAPAEVQASPVVRDAYLGVGA